MTDADAIEAMGGPKKVSALFEVTSPAVSQWKVNGIPWQHRIRFKELARKKKVRLPDDFLVRKCVAPSAPDGIQA